jgi:ATP-binding protein involved in chromosome partitioning
MTQEERSNVMQRARFQASQQAPPTEVSATTRVIAVGSGKGGVGKSSITANLAAALAARGFTVGVLDADIWGFSIPRMLGVQARLAGSKMPDGTGKILPFEVDVPGGGTLKVVSMGLLVDDEDTALMWRGLILAKALEQFLVDVRWGDLDYLLIDMPPGTGDVAISLGQLFTEAGRRVESLVVTTPNPAAQRVAERAAAVAHRMKMEIAGVVENMSYRVCPCCGERDDVFGTGGGQALADKIGVSLLAQVPLEPAVRAGGDDGVPLMVTDPGSPAGQAFTALAQQLARTATSDPAQRMTRRLQVL